MSKKRVIKDFDKLPENIQGLIRKEFPAGFAHKLVSYQGAKGERISALPFETEDTVYLVRWSIQEFKPVNPKDDDLDEVFVSTRDDIAYDDVETPASSDEESDDYSSDDYGMAGGSGSDSDDRDDNDY